MPQTGEPDPLVDILDVPDGWEEEAKGIGIDPDAPLTNAMLDRWTAHQMGMPAETVIGFARDRGIVRDPEAFAKDAAWTLRDHVSRSREWADAMSDDA
jgi:hypothetical protein